MRKMSSVAMLQTQISAIMDVLAKAAVAEICQLLEEDAAALHQEIRRRNEEIRGLKTRLLLTETELQRLSPDRCSVGTQVEITDTREPAVLLGVGVSAHSGPDDGGQEKLVSGKHLFITEEKPEREDPREPEEEELGGLEFEMKIEQVEELVDQKLNQFQAEQKNDGDPRSSKAVCDPESLKEQRFQMFPDPFAMTEDPAAHQGSSGLFSFSFGASGDAEYGLNLPGQEHSSGSADSAVLLFSRPKPFRCEECGKSFTQRMRLITHRRGHTGEKPFRCQLCGKTFSRQDNCLRHVRLHSGQR